VYFPPLRGKQKDWEEMRIIAGGRRRQEYCSEKTPPPLFALLKNSANGTLRSGDHLFASDGETPALRRDEFIETNNFRRFSCRTAVWVL
jgi:hypothetical protein